MHAGAQSHGEKLKRLYGCIYDRSCQGDNTPTGDIERKYYAKGPWPILEITTDAACDSRGNKCTLYYPDLRASTLKHPLVTWGNGTLGRPETYAYFLKHLASWGFVIVATHEQNTLTNGK